MSSLEGHSGSEPNVCRCCERADAAAIRHGAEAHALTLENARYREALGKIANAAELQLGFVAQREIAREALDV